MVKGKYRAPILCERPILEVFDTIDTKTTQQLSLFFLAFCNRTLWMSAIRIRKELNIAHDLNTLHVRYLLLIMWATIGKKDVSTTTIEKHDYPKQDRKRLITMLSLGTSGLCTVTQRTSRAGRIKYSIGLTELGMKAITIVNSVVNEVIHRYPKQNDTSTPIRGIDKGYRLTGIIDSDYRKGRKAA